MVEVFREETSKPKRNLQPQETHETLELIRYALEYRKQTEERSTVGK